MSPTIDYLLHRNGTSRTLEAQVIAIAYDESGTAAFGLGDGTVHLHANTNWHRADLCDGAVLTLAADGPAGFLAGDDNGALSHIALDATITEIATYPGKWVDHVATHGSVRACAVGKKLHLFDTAARPLKTLEHPNTIGGIAFDAKGKRIAAAHYNGVSLWYVASKTDNPRRLEWKGSHLAVAIAPDGDSVVTAMQENALHGWRLTDGQNMRMSGYPAKCESIAFTRSGRWLASAGADAIVLWPFFGGGPMGKAPLELAGGGDVLCTRVATHPKHELCAAGFANGLVVLVDIATERLLPVAPPHGGSVTALAWNQAGTELAFGTEQGGVALVNFSK